MMRYLALVAGALVLAGCGGKTGLPKTYPVKGKVVDAGGTALKGGGQVQFQSSRDTTLTVVGNISGDGSFSLRTIKNRQETAGAPEGEYQVTVARPIPEGQRSPPPPVTLPAPYRVEAGENNFTLRLP